MVLLSDGSVYSNPSFVKGIVDSLLLPADHKRLAEIGLVQATEWSMTHIYQVQRVVTFDVEILLSVELNVLCLRRV